MKTCVKCGKNVANGTHVCPNCGSLAFSTDNGRMEGTGSLIFDWFFAKNPKLAVIIVAILTVAAIGFAIWLYTSFLSA